MQIKFYRFANFSKLRRFYVGFAFIVAIHFITVCELNSLFATKEINSAFRNILFVTSEYPLLSAFLIVCWGLVRLVVILLSKSADCFNCLYFRELVRNHLQMITTIQSDINVRTSSV
jgi:hypothetical protein